MKFNKQHFESMINYQCFSTYYDRINRNTLKKQTAFFQSIINKYHIRSMIDLACGTGELLCQLRPGLSVMHGCDLSTDMIKVASQKLNSADICKVGNMIDYFPSQKYSLASCNFDSINYLLSKKMWLKFFENTFNLLENEGIFVFDFITCFDLEFCWPRSININKGKGFLLLRLSEYDNKRKLGIEIQNWYLHINSQWNIFKEVHYHKSFPANQILKMLTDTGYKIIQVNDENGGPLSDQSIRGVIIARK